MGIAALRNYQHGSFGVIGREERRQVMATAWTALSRWFTMPWVRSAIFLVLACCLLPLLLDYLFSKRCSLLEESKTLVGRSRRGIVTARIAEFWLPVFFCTCFLKNDVFFLL